MSNLLALATNAEARGHDHDLAILATALDARSQPFQIVDWDDPSINWSRFAAVVLRSTWDYHKRYEQFLDWVNHVSAVTTLHNSVEIVRWNTDKIYLQELVQAGIPVIATSFVRDVSEIDTELLSADIIVKPIISAGSNNTARHRANAAAAAEHVCKILGDGVAVLVQPYVATIDAMGETGLVYLNGEFSHAFHKAAIFSNAAQDHNGVFVKEKISSHRATAGERQLGERVCQFVAHRFGSAPLYARIDMVATANGESQLMEVELTEPSLYLHTDPVAPDRAAIALVSAVAAAQR